MRFANRRYLWPAIESTRADALLSDTQFGF